MMSRIMGLTGNAIPLNAFYASYPGYSLKKYILEKNVKGMEQNAFAMCRKYYLKALRHRD